MQCNKHMGFHFSIIGSNWRSICAHHYEKRDEQGCHPAVVGGVCRRGLLVALFSGSVAFAFGSHPISLTLSIGGRFTFGRNGLPAPGGDD
jgi:hypothetical protein